MSTMPGLSRPNTTRRCTVEVALYRCMMARFAPRRDSKVRRISGSRAWVRTWTVTSSGISFSSISLRTKSKSVWDAAGKPISISLKPHFSNSMNMHNLRSASIGSINAWLPSRRSTLHQTGGRVMTRFGQVRSANATGAKERYFCDGILIMAALARRDCQDPPGVSGGLGDFECGFSLCARGAQQQAGQQKAGGKNESAVLLGVHARDYKDIFQAPQAPSPVERCTRAPPARAAMLGA